MLLCVLPIQRFLVMNLNLSYWYTASKKVLTRRFQLSWRWWQEPIRKEERVSWRSEIHIGCVNVTESRKLTWNYSNILNHAHFSRSHSATSIGNTVSRLLWWWVYTDVPARDIFYTDNPARIMDDPANFYLFTNICILIIQNPNTFKKYWQRLTFILDVSVHLHVDFTLNFLLFLL